MVSQDIPPPSDKAARRKRLLMVLALFGVSIFMYVAFIIKTAVRGP